MDPLLRVWNQARAYWGGLSRLVRGLIIGASALAVVAVGTFSYFNQSGDGQPLFASGLPEEEVAAITAVLESKSITHKLKDSHTILVPKDLHPKARVALAAEGLPAGGAGKGFRAFDTSNPMGTPAEHTVKLQRAIQDELARSIMQLEPVAAARVIIARPESSPFIRFQRPATASVVLKLKPGATFSREQATSVVMLVSRSVDGLAPEHVTVVDSSGRMLSQPQTADKDDLPQGLMEQQEKVEQHLAAKAQELLTAHLGVGKAVVTVRAELDPKKLKESKTEYPKNGTVPRAERTTTLKSTTAPRGGVAGTGSNVRPASATGGGGGSTTEEVQQTDYNTSMLVREMEQRMGAITRLTVAVVADLTLPPAAEGQAAATALTVAQVEQLVRDAVGTNDSRGDRVTVMNTKLSGLPTPTVNEPDEETLRIQRMAAYVELARNISLAVAVVMAVAVIGLLLVRRRPQPSPASADSAETAPPLTPEQRRKDLLDKFIDTARADPSRTAAALGLLLGPSGG